MIKTLLHIYTLITSTKKLIYYHTDTSAEQALKSAGKFRDKIPEKYLHNYTTTVFKLNNNQSLENIIRKYPQYDDYQIVNESTFLDNLSQAHEYNQHYQDKIVSNCHDQKIRHH